ncbi:MAG: protein kinase domain-containing protein [Candidatus Eiseniibacteriota bacterium]
MTASPFAAGLGDRYRLDREIGRGGMATVYRADDLKHGRPVAIKVMHPELARAIGHDRFLREIEIAASLTHPHILPLFDSGAVEGQVYYVMPYIAGDSLRVRLERERQLGIDEALRLTREIASALGFAHHRGLIHRDVKPENVLLADGIALVADFGIARAIRPPATAGAAADSAPTRVEVTVSGAVLGTPRYMAPEQASGTDVDARADVYALACVLYEMLAGVPPFVAPTHEALVHLHLTAAPRPVTEYRPNVPQAVTAAIARALEKVPADRFATMAQFAEALAVRGTATPTPAVEAPATATPHNLSRQRSRFVGRERELAECARLLAETRLLTFTGVGGSGKTRLALRLAESLLDTFVDGVWVIDLAPVESDALPPQILAHVIGADAATGQSPEEAVIARLTGQRVLLLFDNCEHLLEPVSALVDRLLAALPELKVLITSREGLGIEGERLFAVRSLALPPADAEDDPESLLRYEAVRLFVTRAQEVDPEFTLDRTNAALVKEVCRRLDGIPLALELAAARTRALSIEQIARMLDDRFRLLTGSTRTALERHRTLRATVQWSYDHLEADERDLFVTLSVFAGGWSLDAAARVAGADEFDVLDRLTRLIDKSLVVTDRAQGEVRYRMLETLRQFGLEVLAASGRADAVRSEHLDHYVAWVDGLKEELRQPYPGEALRRLRADADNLRAALNWGFQNAPAKAVELNRRLVRMWFVPGYYAEGRRWYGRTLALGEVVRPVDRAEAMARSARLASQQGDNEAALRLYEQELEIQRALGDKARIARAMVQGAIMMSYLGRTKEAEPLFLEARALYAEQDDRDGVIQLDNALGLNCYLGGDMAAARRWFESALAIAVEIAHPGRTKVALGNLAVVDVRERKPDEARRHLRESMKLNEPLENLYGIAHDLPALAEAIRLEGDARSAAQLIGAADALLEKIEAKLEALEADVYDQTVAALRSELGEGAFAAARKEGRSIGWKDVIPMA